MDSAVVITTPKTSIGILSSACYSLTISRDCDKAGKEPRQTGHPARTLPKEPMPRVFPSL
eukprot:scaffold249961_cov21-Tisochrysis_lutea.AAC.2